GGDLAGLRGRFDQSAASYQEAVGVWRGLVGRHPEEAEHRASLACALRWLGLSLQRGGRHDLAAAACREAVEILARLPRTPGRRDDEVARAFHLGVLHG